MAKDFAFKDVRSAINSIKKLAKELNIVSNYQDNKIKEIKKIFLSLDSSNYFSNISNNDLIGKDSYYKDDSYDKMLLSMYQYMISIDTIKHTKDLIKQIDDDTNRDIQDLIPGSNPVFWIFSSGKKKALTSEAYERLSKYNNSYIIEDANNVIKTVNDYETISVASASKDFQNNKSNYNNLIKSIIVSPDLRPKVEVLNDALSKYNNFLSKIEVVLNDARTVSDKIKKSIDRLIAEELLKILRNIPIEEINRDKKGIRIKPLRDAGYTNLANLYVANVYNLQAVYGVSQAQAYNISRIVSGYANEARKGIKIKLSFDDKNKYTNDVVKSLYIYKQKKIYLKNINDICFKYESFFNKAIDLFNNVGSGRFWTFYSDEYKNEIKNNYNMFSQIINGEYGKVINESIDGYKKLIVNESLEEAWDDFKNNSIDFYNIIEEVYPGILEHSDSVYGLPEDLAREVQDEVIYPDGLLCTLRRYQEWGVKYILHQERVLLGDEMGLGKTIQAIATMVSLRNTGATHFVVVCPASVITNWCREITKHSKLRVMKAHGQSKNSVVSAWVKNGGVVVTTYESSSAFKLDPYFRFTLMVVDEAHYIKNKGAARTTRTIELSHHADRILFMTGTALENNVNEMISLIEVLNPRIAQQVENIAFLSEAPQFRNKIAPVYYRRKREDVLTELPDKIETEEWCTMCDVEKRAYIESLSSKNYMSIRRVSWNVDDLNYSTKMNRLKEIVEESKNDDRKILVFSFFLNTINKIIENLGTEICLNPINGSINPTRRQEIIDEFDKAPAGTVLCAQIQSGGTGLNIQSASVVIICEPQLKPSIENQAISRAYRMGQSRKVQVFRLLSENTIDERILDLLKQKQAAFDAFADKSVAAENFEIDEKTFGDIIKQEIERINKEKDNNVKESEN